VSTLKRVGNIERTQGPATRAAKVGEMTTARQSAKRATAHKVAKPAAAKRVLGEVEGAPKTTRRRRGEPRRLLLEAARDLFTSQGFSGTSTREIAAHAEVSETLLFSYFGSKVGLFREALVAPFVEFVEDFNAKWQSGSMAEIGAEELSRRFIGDLFDLFRKNRGLVVMFWAADAQTGSELAEIGVFDEINDELRVLVDLGTAAQGRAVGRQELVTRSTLAMVAGMAVFGRSFYGRQRPSRRDIVEELTQAVLHGHLHRGS
jgi:AcrR family transcriptional regulator